MRQSNSCKWKTLKRFALFSLGLLQIQAFAGGEDLHPEKNRQDIFLEARAYYGWTVDHHIEMTQYRRHYLTYEISAFKVADGKSYWEYKYNHPLLGLSFYYSDLGNTRPLGSVYAVFPYINFPLTGSSVFKLYFRLGVGLGYMTKKYERYDNYENIAIGSHLNGGVSLVLEARYRISNCFMASGGLSWTHFSNGAVRQPNYGINIPGINLALAYRIIAGNGKSTWEKPPEYSLEEKNKWRQLQLEVTAAAGMKDLRATLGGGKRYAVIEGNANLMWGLSYKSRLGFGLDISYDGSDEKQLAGNDIYPENRINLVKTGITGNYKLVVSKLGIMLDLGVNLTGLYKQEGTIYEKLILRYSITDKLFAALALKAYYAKADFVTLGLGYKIRIKTYKQK